MIMDRNIHDFSIKMARGVELLTLKRQVPTYVAVNILATDCLAIQGAKSTIAFT